VGTIARLLGKDPHDWPKNYASYRSDMTRAAGVGVARIRCHRHTWLYLEQNVPEEAKSGPGIAFCPPGEDEITTEPDGMVTVPLAGTALAATLYWCREAQSSYATKPWTPLDSAIGKRVGAAISRALRNLVPSTGPDGPTAFVYLDDRIAAKDATT
jgi:hypothetical protein